ncbi:PREDICTED: CAAX prenyl protease 1 homolog [Priapulus caudatus]|uniref:CAAX prenyl protease 1 homolog n=1 Tax=Priapulus caudatus TaxID=37621 RepID=A0ABM1EZ07_PRICU|nr:PREDICTED: CAAX prenyl protease 1 homolog [Priapulus caudatus]
MSILVSDVYLSPTQRKVYRTSSTVPHELAGMLSRETFEKARLYNLDKSSFGFWSSLYSQLETSAILLLGGIPFLWNAAGDVIGRWGYTQEDEITQSMAFLLLLSVYSTISSMPWSLYCTFVVEEKHGFNKQSMLADFNREQTRFCEGKQGRQAGEAVAVPPWVGYNDEEQLKKQILALSQDKRNFLRNPPGGVPFNFDYATSHPVAMATLNDDANLQKMRFELVNLFLCLCLFAMLISRQELYAAFGFPAAPPHPVLIGLIIIFQFVFSPYNELVSFAMTALSRRFEFQADAFARSLRRATALRGALCKLNADNLSFPLCDPLFSTYHYSHPPLLERLRALRDDDKQD